MTTFAFIGAAFIIGYLLGDRRGVRQCNEILDHNQQLLLKAIGEPDAIMVDGEDNTDSRPTVH